MTILPKRDPLVLLLGDVLTFTLALWLTLLFRNFEFPTIDVFVQHLVPFAILFVIWLGVFLLSGLYDRSSRLLRSRLPEAILLAQTINVSIAAVFFFLIPVFGIAPKVVLGVYLLVSSALIFAWRVAIYPRFVSGSRTPATIIGSGDDMLQLISEVNGNPHYPFMFTTILDTKEMQMSEVVQQVCRIGGTKDSAPIIVADTNAQVMQAILPIVYDVAFSSQQFTFIDVNDLYQEVFERVSLAHIQYDWILAHVGRPAMYDFFKRLMDILLGVVGCIGLAGIYPIIALAIKLEDGGTVFATMERVGRYGQSFSMFKFRSMSGNDGGVYTNGKTKLTVTRVGRFLRKTHLDETPQFINLLRGEMSFVGPRPEVPSLAAQYAARIPFYNARHLIAPGLTGWARVRHVGDPHGNTNIEETKINWRMTSTT